MNGNLVHLFPIPVSFYNDIDLSQSEVEAINKLETKFNINNLTSVENYIFKNHKAFKRLEFFCYTAVNDFFKEAYAPENKDLRLKITQSWANFTLKGQMHHKHSHPNSIVSGVYYINADIEVDRIRFFQPSLKIWDVPSDNYLPTNSETWWFSVGTGTLILFPSTLEHCVDPVTHDNTRISLSFNTFFSGTAGSDYQLTELIL